MSIIVDGCKCCGEKARKRGSKVGDEGIAVLNRKLGKTLQRTKSDRSRFCIFLQTWLYTFIILTAFCVKELLLLISVFV